MCGIYGILSNDTIKDRKILTIGIQKLRHRGPDDYGEIWLNRDTVGLAHQRLAIIDTSKAGHQPMSNRINNNTIIFNGEIYNFKSLKEDLKIRGRSFFSNSDTEVLLQAYEEWGTDCLNKIEGMFSLAIYDNHNKTLFLARDRAGEKPLYYYQDDRSFRFASELKAILSDEKIERSVDISSLDCYLNMGFVPGERCILDGFSKLPPAHALIYSLNTHHTKIWKYWSLPQSKKNFDSKFDLVEKLRTLLEKSIESQLVSDVPLGILLSGGTDSSIITAIASKLSPGIKTFTVNFPNGGKFDESQHARLISNHFKTDHVELDVNPPNASLFEKLAIQFDEPLTDSSMIPTFLISELVSNHCKVVLGGDGGDELFGGYEHHSRLLWLQTIKKFVPDMLVPIISIFISRRLPQGFKGRNWIRALRYDLDSSLPLIATYFDEQYREDLLKKYQNDFISISERVISERTPKEGDLIDRLTRMDFHNFLPEDVLTKVDRASMANSLEVRAPFLDKKIIEFAFSELPSKYKATHNNKKIILKELAKDVLPKDFNLNRKQGFSAPINMWLHDSEFRDYFYEILLDDSCIFDKGAVEKLFVGHQKGFNNSERLFSLLMFELWRRAYKVRCFEK